MHIPNMLVPAAFSLFKGVDQGQRLVATVVILLVGVYGLSHMRKGSFGQIFGLIVCGGLLYTVVKDPTVISDIEHGILGMFNA